MACPLSVHIEAGGAKCQELRRGNVFCRKCTRWKYIKKS